MDFRYDHVCSDGEDSSSSLPSQDQTELFKDEQC